MADEQKQQNRKKRLTQQLRTNLLRRKHQARERRTLEDHVTGQMTENDTGNEQS
ncbi:MAG: Hypothetical protein BHV28_14990 [Candidatus Tokpelaia hoelldobleri]|uniref:Uncharacterized protein n=1 Tax=Candidatus Tokpelaia hoelldobleri TaxID=1902579 RepID=A0A1U9JWC9_9HYPH|nr:MAG: Hypothetical protein BHV28_14990 [Candidatus Tokpelaia hoelldoblerii]